MTRGAVGRLTAYVAALAVLFAAVYALARALHA
jgi:hypothetical protein